MRQRPPRKCAVPRRAWLLVLGMGWLLTGAPLRAQPAIPLRIGSEVPTAEAPVGPSAAAALPARAPDAWQDTAFDDVVAVGRDGGWHCSGVLIHARMVLTARHCLPAERVALGPDVSRPRAIHRVSKGVPAPERWLDAAVLVLDTAVAAPVAAWRAADDDTPPVGFLRAVGFGSTNRLLNQTFGRKRFVETFTTGWGCDVHRAAETQCRQESELVLTGGANRDTCNGDSGGPLFEQHEQRRRLLAITSRSADPLGAGCGSGGIYVRVDRLDPWLQRERSAREKEKSQR